MVSASLVDENLVKVNLEKEVSRGQALSTGSVAFPIVEMFHSIQGEGSWAGSSAFFIRLAGCNVGCSWCDTKESWSKRAPKYSVADIRAAAAAAKARLIVVTGGEPLMHDLEELTSALSLVNSELHLETSGAYPLTGRFSWITLSPKQNRPPHPSIYSHASELKVVVANRTDLEWAEEQARLLPADVPKRLQPEWNTPESDALVYQYILENPAWQMSLQTHKYVGVH